MAGDWRSIENDREKYAAYLCSREWAVLKEAVHKRAGGKCERCRLFPIDAVHHKTYARKYNEQLDDLEGHCKHCHAFTHGKSDFDPYGRHWALARYVLVCCESNRMALPPELHAGARVPSFRIQAIMRGVDSLIAAWRTSPGSEELEEAMVDLDYKLPFLYWPYVLGGVTMYAAKRYASIVSFYELDRAAGVFEG